MRAKKKVTPEGERAERWAYYQTIQRTPEQKAESQKELKALCEEAGRNGVYDRVLELVGKVKFDIDVDELREDRD